MRGRATRVALPAFAVLALIAVVAVAATGSTPAGSNESRAPSETLLDALFTIYLLAIVAGGCLFVYGMTQRDAIRKQVASGRFRRVGLSTWVFALIVFAAVSYFRARHWKPPFQDPGDEPAFPGHPPKQGTSGSKTPIQYEPSISWLAVAVVVLLVAAAVAAFVVSERRRRGSASAELDLGDELAVVL